MPPGVGYNQSGVPLSPPGALSQRTDMQPQGAMQIPDAAYGEQQAFQEIQGGAPMAGPAAPPPIGMGAPTNHHEAAGASMSRRHEDDWQVPTRL